MRADLCGQHATQQISKGRNHIEDLNQTKGKGWFNYKH